MAEVPEPQVPVFTQQISRVSKNDPVDEIVKNVNADCAKAAKTTFGPCTEMLDPQNHTEGMVYVEAK